MAIRIGWDEFEVALLIDACNQVLEKKIAKPVIVSRLSAALRKRAVKQGIEIDEIFRNENGILLQMTKMDYLLTDGKVGLPGASKLYAEIAELSKSNPVSFAKLLVEAQKQIGAKEAGINMSTKEKFSQWLSANPSPKYRDDAIIKALDEGSDYCRLHSISKESFWDITEKNRFTSVTTKLLGMRIYRLTHKNTVLVLDKAVSLYKEFLNQVTYDEKTSLQSAKGTTKTKIIPIEELVYSKDDREEVAHNKLVNVTTMLQQRYCEHPAVSHTEIIDSKTYEDSKEVVVEEPVSEMKISLFRALEYLKTRYDVRLHYDHFANPNSYFNDMLYKVRNGKKDIMWIYYIHMKSVHYISVETEPEYLTNMKSEPIGFTRIQRRAAHPCQKMFFEDYEAIRESLTDICDSIDMYFAASAPAQPESEHTRIYQKLYSISRVYDDPTGLSVERIMAMLGAEVDEQKVRDVLDDADWAVKLSDNVYSFSKRNVPVLRETVMPYAATSTGDITSTTGQFVPSREKSVLTSVVQLKTQPEDFDKDKFEEVLLRRHRNGMQFDSIDFENFRDMYYSLFDEGLAFDDDALEERLRYCGVIYKDRLFPAEGIIDSNTKEKLFSYIDNSFASGKKVIYYKAIFEDLSDAFASCFTLSDENMLKAYIEYSAEKGKYFFFSDYMSIEKHVTIDHKAEVEEFLLNAGKPMLVDDVCAALSHIPQDQVRRIITTDNHLLRNAKGEYFHIDIFEVSGEELEQISVIINRLIAENEYAIWTDVWNEIQEKMPIFLENNLYLSWLGVRNAIELHYVGEFNFEGAVISLPKDRFAMRDVYQLYAKHHAEFTADDIYNLSKELDTVIYFDALAEVSVRVSRELFVSKKQINFDADAIDKAIGSFIAKDYIRIREIDSFLVFPNVGYEWNEYLLESFVASYSKKFALLSNGYALNNVAGAIVKKDGEIKEFVDVCAAVLADSGISLKKAEALNYLADVNLITRRSYRDLDTAIRKATQIRGRKE